MAASFGLLQSPLCAGEQHEQVCYLGSHTLHFLHIACAIGAFNARMHESAVSSECCLLLLASHMLPCSSSMIQLVRYSGVGRKECSWCAYSAYCLPYVGLRSMTCWGKQIWGSSFEHL